MKIERSGLSRLAMTVGTVFLLAGGLACSPAAPPPGSDTELPRAPDGKPDFSGIWQSLTTASWNLEDHSAEEGVPAGQTVVDLGTIPYQEWALAARP